MMRSLELQEKIRLRDLLDREIVASQRTENEQELDSAVKCFRRE